MTYFISDIHGEYDLFLELLDKINFSDDDVLYVLGDMVDKGERSIKVVDFVRETPNIKAIVGNHEYSFLKRYHGLMKSLEDGDDIDAVLQNLREYFPGDGERLTWETVDFIEALPYYIETDDFICVHAGVETDERGKILPMGSQLPETMVYSRNFKDDDFNLSSQEKTVLFGHTPCSYQNGTGKFIKTPKSGVISPKTLCDYSKIQLDCGVFLTGMLGILRLEDMKEFYLKK